MILQIKNDVTKTSPKKPQPKPVVSIILANGSSPVSQTSSQAAGTALTAFLPKKIRRKLAGLLLLSALAGMAGCGSSADPDHLPVFPAKGQITFSGKSLQGAFVVLHPRGKNSTSDVRPRGHVAADGQFALSTYETNDGAPEGEYKVTVECRSLVKRPNGDVVAGPNVLPKQYSKPDSSPITLKIAAGNNSLPPIILK